MAARQSLRFAKASQREMHRSMGLAYHVLDVFTERRFGGNPLAAVLDADALTPSEMQSIAREFNLSETVFVLKATSPGHTARMRIFTPSRELPFAGHPTLGTAVLLAELRNSAVNGEHDAIIALEVEVGSVRVGVRLKSGAAHFGEFDAPSLPGQTQALSENGDISAALGLIPSEITFENHKPTRIEGNPSFAYVPVANLEVMAKVQPAPAHWGRAFTDRGVEGVYLYCRQAVKAQAAFHARMLAPDLGVPEDPATGSAAIGFARVIQQFDECPDGIHKRTIEQGVEMGRPSAILLTMTVAKGELESVRIGGHCVRVAEGTLL
ncbi:MAG: PhzF family phenazine biosynthesis protein [Hyphomicrobium sp.]